MQFPFIGGSYSDAILRADAQSTINLFPETDKSGNGKSKVQLVGTPGLQVFTTLPDSPIRGIWIGEQRMFVVAGANLYEVFSGGTYTNRSAMTGAVPVGNDGFPAQVFPNGNQIGIVSAGGFYCDNGAGPVQPQWPGNSGTAISASHPLPTNNTVHWVSGNQFDNTMLNRPFTLAGTAYGTVTQVLSPTTLFVSVSTIPANTTGAYSTTTGPVLASSGTYMDGYAIIVQPSSAQINISSLYDFSTWNQLDYGIKEGYPDHIRTIIADQSNLYLLGSNTLEIWQDTGNADFPFQRIPGEILQIGCAAQYSPDKLPDGIALLAADFRGAPMAILIQGYQYSRISTAPLERIWQEYSTYSDAVGYCYLDAGHAFWVLSFPTANATWAYDRTEDQWHQRAYNGITARTRGYLHGYCWGQHYVGDWNSGNIYSCSLDYFDDAGTPITRQRTAAHIADENKRTFYSQFTLDVQTGQVANPAYTLDLSNDGGNTWPLSYPQTPSWAATGTYNTRFNWRRLGSSRVRTFRVTSTAPIRHRWIDGYFEAIASGD